MKSDQLLVMLICLLFSACKHSEISSEAEFYKWLNDEKNGLSITKKVNGYKLNVKYLPAEFLVYSELKSKANYSGREKDSLIEIRKKSRTFLLTIGPDHERKSERDVMYEGVNNYQEYKERSHRMNFQMGSMISLNAGSETYSPAISTLENIYSLGNQRSLYLIFSDNGKGGLLKTDELDFSYEDEIFETGISHFIFRKSNIDNIPLVSIKNN